MKLLRTALLAVPLLLATVPAFATPVSDPEAWSKSFIDAAMSSDSAKLTAVVTGIASARLPKDRIGDSIKGVVDHFGDRKPIFGERFEATKLGTFLVRYRFAFGYPEQYLFYGIDLVRSEGGWELYNLKMSTNLNELMADPYPFK